MIHSIPLSKMERVVLADRIIPALRSEVDRLASRSIFIIASGSLREKTRIINEICHELGSLVKGIYSEVPAHTPIQSVLDCSNMARKYDIDLVLTIGGGSVTDAGKAVCLCLHYGISDEKQLQSFFNSLDEAGRRIEPEFEAPRIIQLAVPSTLSGGEFNFRAGLTDRHTGIKRILGVPLMIPSSVVLCPEVSRLTPNDLFFSTGIRALDHAIETLFSLDANSYSDALALQAVRLLRHGLTGLHANEDNDKARMDCHVGAWLSMGGVVSRMRMGASHAIGHVLGSKADVPHGLTSCVILPSVLRFNGPAIAPEKREMLCDALGDASGSAADFVHSFIRSLGLPSQIRECNVKKDMLPVIAELCMKESWIYSNPREISESSDILQILQDAY